MADTPKDKEKAETTVQILPILDQHRGCRRLSLPEILHLPEP